MNRMQIGLALGMEVLGIEVSKENYREICDATFLAERRGVYLSPSSVNYDVERNCAYSPMSHESSGDPSWNLFYDVCDILEDRENGINSDEGWKMDEGSLERLGGLRKDIEREGLKALLRKSQN
tara:strand:- start:827 stop:1198 length:372 start_codon:yes stop_codon:yes gene_type:complete